MEYPAGLAVAGVLVYAALRRPRAQREPEPPVWTRHEQVVRPVPDPELDRLGAPLRAWVERGAEPEAAALVLARAQAREPADVDRLVPDLLRKMSSATSSKSRRKLLNALAKNPRTGA